MRLPVFIRRPLGSLGLSLVLLGVGLGAPQAAAAAAGPGPVIINKPGRGPRPMLLDLHGCFTHFGVGPAVGARFAIPIVDNGFVPVINNSVSLTFGGDFYWVRIDRDDYAAAIGFPVTLQWRFFFTPRWSAFGEVGFNLFLHPNLVAGDGWRWYPNSWVVSAIGGRYQVSDRVHLVARLGSPYSSFGVSFAF